MAKLKATRSILYQNRLYDAGDELPTNDVAMVNAWLTVKSAVMDEEVAAVKTAEQTETTPGSEPKVKKASQTTKTTKKKANTK